MTLTLEESETHFNIVADDRSKVFAYSDDPVFQRRLERVGAKLVKTEVSGGRHYEMSIRQLLIRKVPAAKVLSDEQKAALVAKLQRK